MREWHRDSSLDVIELLVSELVTNAVLHARSDVEIVLNVDDGTIRVEVVDGSRVEPVLRGHDDEAMTGRGLALVAYLATDWGITPLAGGKSVWFTVAA